MPQYAEIILPLPLQGYFTYSIPHEWEALIEPGMRVVVSFGSKKFYAGIVARLVPEVTNNAMQIKEIIEILDTEPVITPMQLEFWQWMAAYYMCSVGEVMNAAIPSGLKMESSTIYVIHPDFNDDFSNLSDDEYMIAEAALRAEQLTPADIQSITGRQGIHKLIKSLIEKKVIYPVEELEERYTPKKQKFVSLSAEYENGGVLNALMVKLESKSPVQYKALMAYFNLAMGKRDVSLTVLNKEGGTASVAALVKKNILLVEERTVSRLDKTNASANTNSFDLSPAQQSVLEDIQNAAEPQKPTLLFGVTGSGKTEIYIRLIQEMLSQGKHVLYLLPEIGLTDFIVERLRIFFGTSLLVYHSRFNAQEKVEIWKSLLGSNTPKLVVGARSAIFLPFDNPGLIIVDEEHDSSYKQQDPAPRYHARDSAVMLAHMTGARVLLGSGTPSLESWHNAISENYNLVELAERYGNARFPDVSIVDIRKASFTKKMLGPLSPELYEATKTAVSRKRQVILFQNRRGYSTWIECEQCGWTPICRNCDVSMTYHKNIELLKCHYCGFTDKTPQKCPSCGSSQVMMRGMGTQRIEDELGIIFKDSMIARMDMDTTRGKKALTELFKGFDDGRFPILVGTQMITKGLDFSRVDVVGILNGDNMHTFPDFRAHEHAFQTMMQVAGRAGRRDNRGRVFIQVYDKNNPIVRFVAEENYKGFMEAELQSRMKYLYPPFVRLIRLSVLHKDKLVAMKASEVLLTALRSIVGEKQLLGPEFPPVPRVKNNYIRNILVKLPRNKKLQDYKSRISAETTILLAHPDFKGIRVIADADPV
ncbi:MAG: primosomal protein N' [Bacteroidetes bacterium HGW-Bacteroidetes-6]|jgi:primosomal protein N' (replication factor Y)|nr:MAG: primosomal protein N' [Bacteroidetes bacterium HGW-Bacteroidetes-6]